MKLLYAIAATAAIALPGCAGSPMRLGLASAEELSAQSNYNLCRAASSMYSNAAMDAEVVKRGIDCGPYVAAARSRQQAMLGAGAAIMSAGQQPVVRPPEQTRCNKIGDFVTCNTY